MPSNYRQRSLGLGGLNRASEDAGRCDAVLVPDVTVIQENLTVKVAFFLLINEENYSTYKQQYGATFPEYFQGDYSGFEEKRSKLMREESLEMEVYEAKSVLQTVVGPEKVNAWLQCVTQAYYGIFAYLNDANDEGVTVKVVWVPPPGLGALQKPQLVLDQGTSMPNNFENAKEFVGSAEIIVRRSVKDDWVRGTVNGIAGANGSYSARFYLPPVAKPHTVVIDDKPNPSMQLETRFVIPSSPQPKDIEFTLQAQTQVTGEYFTQAPRHIQQYVWLADSTSGPAAYDSGEVGGFGEGEVKTLTSPELKLQVKAGSQRIVRVRNSHKGARLGPTTLRWKGSYTILK